MHLTASNVKFQPEQGNFSSLHPSRVKLKNTTYFISNHTPGRLDCSTSEVFWLVFSQGYVYLIHPGLFCLHVLLHPVFFSSCLFHLHLTLLDGFSIWGWGDWSLLWTPGRQAAGSLVCSKNSSVLRLWWITVLLIHSKDCVNTGMRGQRTMMKLQCMKPGNKKGKQFKTMEMVHPCPPLKSR